MHATKIISGLVLAFSILCCGRAEHPMEESNAIADSSSNAFISSSAAVENPKDSTRKFIRTADLKFKVKNVVKSTYDIEDITTRHGGFVTFTNLTSNINNVTNTAISSDSSLETTYYTVTNSITLRVPNIKLDTTLKEISRNIDFLDYRVIKAEDVSLQILSNNLSQKRSAKNEARLTNAIDNKAKKLNETTNAEELLVSKQEQSDNLKISNLSLSDQISFSTINLYIYQRPVTTRELIPNDKNIDEYEPGFGTKLVDSLKSGWSIFESILVSLAKLWGVFLIAVIGYILYRKFARNSKNKTGL